MPEATRDRPDYDRLFELAAAQEGLFTTQQAAEAGYSPQLLIHHVKAGSMLRVQRGIYRLVHFPAGDHEELVTAWLWSQRAGVVSHESALALHGLSDVLPHHIHLTLPADWKKRRFRTPTDVVLHFADVRSDERSWFGAAPTTNTQRTLEDCARASLSPELLHQAYEQALRRGLVTKNEVPTVMATLHSYWGGVS